MPYKVTNNKKLQCVELNLTGEVSVDDHDALIHELRHLPENDTTALLMIFNGFQGMKFGAIDAESRKQDDAIDRFKRVAILADAGDEKAVAMMVQPFSAADVQFFDHSNADKAQAWLTE